MRTKDDFTTSGARLGARSRYAFNLSFLSSSHQYPRRFVTFGFKVHDYKHKKVLSKKRNERKTKFLSAVSVHVCGPTWFRFRGWPPRGAAATPPSAIFSPSRVDVPRKLLLRLIAASISTHAGDKRSLKFLLWIWRRRPPPSCRARGYHLVRFAIGRGIAMFRFPEIGRPDLDARPLVHRLRLRCVRDTSPTPKLLYWLLFSFLFRAGLFQFVIVCLFVCLTGSAACGVFERPICFVCPTILVNSWSYAVRGSCSRRSKVIERLFRRPTPLQQCRNASFSGSCSFLSRSARTTTWRIRPLWRV